MFISTEALNQICADALEESYLWRHWYFTLPVEIQAAVRPFLPAAELWYLDLLGRNSYPSLYS